MLPATEQSYLLEGPQPKKRGRPGPWLRRRGRSVCSSKFWLRRVPVVGFLRNYSTSTFVSDMIAGLTVGLTFIPSSMASATIAGLPPQHGLYASFMCYFVYAVLGSQRSVVIGPSVLTAMLCTPFVDKFGSDIAITLCFYSGIVVSALGVFNLAFLVEFISTPVLESFLSAAAISAISSQIPPLLGISGGGATFVEYWVHIVKNLQKAPPRLWDSLLGCSCIIALVAMQYLRGFTVIPTDRPVSRLERVLRVVLRQLVLARTAVVVLISTGIVAAFTVDGVSPVRVPGEIEEGLPALQLPPLLVSRGNETLGLGESLSVLSTGLTIPLIIVMESTASAKAFAGGQAIDAVQELLAAGMSNLAGSFVQAFPVAASVTRTTINYNAGARTPIGGIFSGLLVMAALGVFSRQLRFLPYATLAAVVITAVPFLIRTHHHTRQLWRSNKLDLVPLYFTFCGCLLLGLDYGMILGIVVNMLLVLYFAARPRVSFEELKVGNRAVLVARPDRSVWYPGAEHVRRLIARRSRKGGPGLLVVLDGEHIASIDSSAVKVIKSLIKELKLQEQDIIFWNWSERLTKAFMALDKTDPGCFRSGSVIEEIVEPSPTERCPSELLAEDSDGESSDSRSCSLARQDLP